MANVKKVVLAYSGGLDTSIILKWLQTSYGAEVVTFTADLGQGEELEPARKKAEMLGIREIHVEDLREEFVRDFVFPMMRMNALYEGVYLLGTSIARPLIAKRLVEIAHESGADAIAHGATGKGNDQVRFELTAYALDPDIKVIAPWREWDFRSRTDLLDFAEKHQIPVPKDKRGEAPFSVDANLLHSSSEGKVLEDPWTEPPAYVFQRTVAPEEAPDSATLVEVGFERGDPVSVEGKPMSPATLLAHLNKLGGDNGVGRVDLVENRFVGMKSRGIYETPGGTILAVAHRAIELLTLDREAAHLKDFVDAALRRAGLLRLLVLARAADAAEARRREPDPCRGDGPPEALQGQRHRHRPQEPEIALFGCAGYLRRRPRRLRSEGRRRLHPPQRAQAADAGCARACHQALRPVERSKRTLCGRHFAPGFMRSP